MKLPRVREWARLNAGLAELRRFESNRDLAVLERAIKHFEAATANHETADPRGFYWLSTALSAGIEEREGPAAAQAQQARAVGISPLTVVEGAMAVRAAQDGIAALERGGDHPRELLAMLCLALGRAYRMSGASASDDLFDEAVQALERGIAARPESQVSVALHFELGQAYLARFVATRDNTALDRAVTYFELLLNEPVTDPQLRFATYWALGGALVTRYELTDAEADIARGLEVLEVVAADAPPSMDSASVHLAIAAASITRYERVKDPADLTRASETSADAVAALDSSSDIRVVAQAMQIRPRVLTNRFLETGDPTYLDEAEAVAIDLVALKPPDTPLPYESLIAVAGALIHRFGARGDRDDFDRAVAMFEAIVEDTEGLHREEALRDLCTLSRLGASFGDLGALDSAVAYGEEALALAQPGSISRVASLLPLAVALRTRFGLTGVLADLERAIDLLDEGAARFPLSSVLAALADSLAIRYGQSKDAGDLNRAMVAAEQAVRSATTHDPDLPAYLAVRSEVMRTARVYERQDTLDLEIEGLEQAVRLDSSSPFRGSHEHWLGAALVDRWRQRHTPADFERGRRLLESALEVTASPSARAQILDQLASAMADRHASSNESTDLERAVEYWEQALQDLAEGYAYSSVVYRLAAGNEWPRVYSDLVSGLVALANIRDDSGSRDALRRALLAAEGRKSRLLSDALAHEGLLTPAGVEPALVEREREIAARIRLIDRSELADIGQTAEASPSARATGSARRRELLSELGALWETIGGASQEGAEYAALRQERLPQWGELAQLASGAGDETALLSLYVTEDRTLLFLLRANWAEPALVEADLGLAAWETVLERFAADVARGFEARQAARDLGEPIRAVGRGPITWQEPLMSILEAAQPHLAGVRRVVISADAASHLVPWGIVAAVGGLTGDTSIPPDVVRSPALSVLSRLRRRGLSGSGALVIGDPGGDLPAARQEAIEVAEFRRIEPLLGEKAMKAVVQERLAESELVHIAAHGYFDSDSPLDSGVRLADQVLSARDAINSHMHADLVVLSACESGVTRGISRDEIAGLSQGFLFAGARSLIVSLWRVDDPATAALMTAFYSARERGLDKAAALRTAMENVRATPTWSDPYFWGGFSLMGDWL